MADEIKINPSPLPAEPFDVPTTPDPPPAQPFDVPTFPSPPPGQPFDVPTYPDPPPASPFDVPTTPDEPTGPPFDVPTTPDGPPTVPFDVPTSADPPPGTPFDVSVEPSGPPEDPIDVATTPSTPPGTPVDVSVEPSPPPAEPFDITVIPSLPPGFPELHTNEKPTIQHIIDAVSGFDSTLGAFLSNLVDVNPVSVSAAGGGALDPSVLAAWFADYQRSVGSAGVAKFVLEQQVLYAMNPVVAKVFDPTYFIKMMVPGSMGNVHTTLDTQLGLTTERIVQTKDKVLQAKVGLNPSRPGGDGQNDRPDAFGPSNKFTDGADFTVDELVTAALDGRAHVFTKTVDGIQRFDASKYFEERDSFGGMKTRAAVIARTTAGFAKYSDGLRKSAALDGIVRVGIRGEEEDGSVLSATQSPSDKVDDDDARLPLCFTDLRKDPVRNAYRSVFFRPLNVTLAKSITPEYGETQGFGRTDPNVAYSKTTKTISLGFEVHAFAPEDLRLMYNKMMILESMCYPSYGSDALMKSGPVTRLRVGDAIGTEMGGLGGVIKGLNFDFADALWELQRGMKVPRSYKVSIEFLVLHDGPVGTLNGHFGVLRLPPGVRPDRDTGLDGALDSQQGKPEQVSVMPGMYARFGEPRR